MAVILASSSLYGQEKKIIILHTNDTHGRIFPVEVNDPDATSQMADAGEKLIKLDKKGEIGGMAVLSSAIQEIRKKYGEGNVLLLDAGDSFSDDYLSKLTKGEANIQLMNHLGYEFMSLGNHDFDFGPERTKELAKIASFPIRGANVIDSATGQPFLGDPTIIIEKNGIKIGIIAAGYRNTHLTTSKKNVRGIRFEESKQHLSRYISALENKADIVVLLSHEGLEYDKELIKNHQGIDIVVGGHSHDITEKAEKVNNTWIVQAFSHGMAVGISTISISDKKITDVSTEIRWLWHDIIGDDSETSSMIDKLSSPYIDTLFKVIGKAANAIPRNYKSGSPFDFLIGEILIKETGSDAAMLPGVGYGITINAGYIRRMDLYSLLPHDSKIATVELTGAQVLKVLEKSAENQEPGDPAKKSGGLIQTAGMEWEADLNKPVGKRVSNVRIKGKEMDPGIWYKIATHTGMLEGLHGYDELSKGRSIEKTDREVTAAVEKYISEAKEISAPSPGIKLQKKIK